MDLKEIIERNKQAHHRLGVITKELHDTLADGHHTSLRFSKVQEMMEASFQMLKESDVLHSYMDEEMKAAEAAKKAPAKKAADKPAAKKAEVKKAPAKKAAAKPAAKKAEVKKAPAKKAAAKPAAKKAEVKKAPAKKAAAKPTAKKAPAKKAAKK